ncbi:hypothetical protein [Yersinia massiliensis]|uniref:Uncharacterized protein n=1 Tax=Yersinia massiliensis TaxID=419257 RepID=A0ABM6UX68_9GAMM|nr:hypothetical protein [Yersinia massiliensis]AVX39031.1 hypothetical protein DA391_15945 [Yersinia massiliensis]
MPIYTSDPGQGINQPISNAPSSLGDALEASFDSGLREGPLVSAIRYTEADNLANDPNSVIVSKAEAEAKLRELGVKSINIPDSGVTKSYLDHVSESRKESLAKQQIAQSAPSGLINTPLNFMAGLAGSMADPANIAIGLVPFAGQAKAATMLGRVGERFVQGSAMGAAQTAVTIPFTAQAAAAEGEDYSMANAMENIFMGTVGGGIMHAGGGVIADMVRGRRTQSATTPIDAVERPAMNAESFLTPESPSPVARQFNENGTTPILSETIARDMDSYAHSKAYEDVVPDYLAQQEATAAFRVDNIADLKNEIVDTNRAIDVIDQSLPERTSAYQQQRMKFKDARNQALNDIATEKEALLSRRGEIEESLASNSKSEVARGEIASVRRGEIPDNLRTAISNRADEIRQSLQLNNITQGIKNASQRIDESHWTVRENAFRAGLSHMMQGKTPDLEPVFNLSDPQLRDASIAQIQQGPRADADISTVNASRDADAHFARANRDNADLVNAQEDLNAEMELATNMVNDIDSPELRGAIEAATREANDESIFKGLQAYATCMLRRM